MTNVREAFEQWYTCPDGNTRALRRSDTNPDGYALMQVQHAWTVWQAAAEYYHPCKARTATDFLSERLLQKDEIIRQIEEIRAEYMKRIEPLTRLFYDIQCTTTTPRIAISPEVYATIEKDRKELTEFLES